jgi:imidazolonepropionase-like amidohydrolase
MKSRTVSVVLAGLALFCATSGRAADADLIIEHARIVSPSAAVIEDATVVVVDGKIHYVGRKPPKVDAARVIDARGRSVIPGLIDTHVHLNLEPLESRDAYQAWVRKGAPLLLQEYLERGEYPAVDADGETVRAHELRRSVDRSNAPTGGDRLTRSLVGRPAI